MRAAHPQGHDQACRRQGVGWQRRGKPDHRRAKPGDFLDQGIVTQPHPQGDVPAAQAHRVSRDGHANSMNFTRNRCKDRLGTGRGQQMLGQKDRAQVAQDGIDPARTQDHLRCGCLVTFPTLTQKAHGLGDEVMIQRFGRHPALPCIAHHVSPGCRVLRHKRVAQAFDLGPAWPIACILADHAHRFGRAPDAQNHFARQKPQCSRRKCLPAPFEVVFRPEKRWNQLPGEYSMII